MTVIQAICIFFIAVFLLSAIHLFHQINIDNPYKWNRICLHILIAMAFEAGLNNNGNIVMAGSVVGFIAMLLDSHLERKDIVYKDDRIRIINKMNNK